MPYVPFASLWGLLVNAHRARHKPLAANEHRGFTREERYGDEESQSASALSCGKRLQGCNAPRILSVNGYGVAVTGVFNSERRDTVERRSDVLAV